MECHLHGVSDGGKENEPKVRCFQSEEQRGREGIEAVGESELEAGLENNSKMFTV